MVNSKEADTGKITAKFIRPSLVVITILAILAVLIAWQLSNSTTNSQSVMAKAQSAIVSLQSYRVFLIHTSDTEGISSEVKVEVEFTAPNSYHVKQAGDADNLEFIQIADEHYYKDSYMSLAAMQSLTNMYSSTVIREAAVSLLDHLVDIQELPKEMIESTLCIHYLGNYDIEEQLHSLQETASEKGLPSLSDEEIDEICASIGTVTVEIWIGEDDFILRQMKRYSQVLDDEGRTRSSSLTLKYYDFNQPIIIEAPVDSEGTLLPGWSSTFLKTR